MTGKSCMVTVPASTSNLGAGFDCVGVAVARSLRAKFTISGSALSISRRGQLAPLQVQNDEDLIWRAFKAAASFAHVVVPAGIVIDADSDIPVARGLGSSAAAVVAGVFAANELLSLRMPRNELLYLAVELEKHPDNVAPAIFGGAILSAPLGSGAFHSAPLTIHPSLRLVFAVPDLIVRTEDARRVLPLKVDFKIAVTAVAKSAALVCGLATADGLMLSAALDDVLHVPMRRKLVRGYDEVVAAATAAGAFGATLSGSGSAIVAVASVACADRAALAMQEAWSSMSEHCETFISEPWPAGAQCVTGPNTQSENS